MGKPPIDSLIVERMTTRFSTRTMASHLRERLVEMTRISIRLVRVDPGCNCGVPHGYNS